jgi:hypothetical protein
MNGIRTIDDGSGTIIEGGNITTDDLSLENLICNNIQGTNPADDVYLYSSTTGVINLGIGATASATTIRTDNLEALTGSTINIGKATETLTYAGTNKLNNIEGITTTSTINLFQNLLTATINFATNLTSSALVRIGSFNSDIRLSGSVGIKGTIISALSGLSATIQLFNNLTTGIIEIGTGITNLGGGSIKIGGTDTNTIISNRIGIKGSTFTALDGINAGVSLFDNITIGNIDMGQGITTGIINIGQNQTATGETNIGGLGLISVGRFRFNQTELDADIGTSTLSLFQSLTTSNILNIANSLGSPTINIGTSSGVNQIGAIVCNTAGGTNRIYPSTSTPLLIGSNSGETIKATDLSLTCSNDLSLTAVGGSVYIGTSALTTQPIQIQTRGSITMAGAQQTGYYVNIGTTSSASSSGLRVYQPITINNGSNWTTPTTSQIGGIVFGTLSGTNSGPFAATRGTMTLTTGVYIINANMRYDSTIAYAIMSISQTNNAIQNICAISGGTTSGTTALNLTRHISIAAGSSITFYLVTQSLPSNISSVVFLATKIA